MSTTGPNLSLRNLAAAGICILAAPSLLFPVNFNAPRAYSLGDLSGGSLAVGDFNGDGHPDLAVAAFGQKTGSGTIEIFLGQSDGSIRHAGNYTLSGLPNTSGNNIVAVDFNHDGKLDLAVSTNTAVSILLGNGDGTFQAAVNYTAGSLPSAITIADFNGDGYADLAIANQNSGNVSILLGNGDGTFQPAVNYAVGTNPEYLAAGDFNADGKPDLAVTNTNFSGAGSVSILFGVGDGTFHRPVNHDVGKLPQSIAVGDFNGDGKPDLAITHAHGGLSILFASGGGGFLPPVAVAAGIDPGGVVARDLNRDGRLDLIVANQDDTIPYPSGYTVSILKSNGDGTFQPPAPYYVAYLPMAIGFGDFNGDGNLDLAVASGYNDVSILPSNGHGGFRQMTNVAAGSAPSSIAVGDFNGDGKLDLAVANNASNNVSILLGVGDGTFLPQVTYSTGTGPISVVTGDFNGDGKLDLAIAVESGVAVLLGNGDGTFQPPVNTAAYVGGPLSAADFNGDGKLDLVSGGRDDVDFVVMLGKGDGTFQPEVTDTEYFVSSVAVGDFNGDGKPDLAMQTTSCADEYCFYYTYTWLGNGDATFDLSATADIGVFPLAVADLNGDGKQDLVSGDLWVALGNGNGTFQAAVNYIAPGVLTPAIADFNGDGKPDLASSGGSDTVGILLGNGDGTFQTQKLFIVGGCPSGVAVGDFNGDGKPDLAVANQCSNNVTILTNTTQ
jgi:hypothetical protein